MSNTTAKPKNEMIQLGVILFAITAIVALLLGFVNAITVDKIAEIKEKTVQDAMAALIPDAAFAEQTVS